MLTELRLQNFRGFDEHTLPLRSRTVIVGRNNAGKSTIVEALRLVALVTGRIDTATFRPVPSWLDDVAVGQRGIQPDLTRSDFDFKTSTHRYGSPPSVITARFHAGQTIKIYVGGPGQVFAVLASGDGKPSVDRARARALHFPMVAILPQIGPLMPEEELLRPDYVRRMMESPRASQHFRNQLRIVPEARKEFDEIIAETWAGVRVRSLDEAPGETGPGGIVGKPILTLMVQNDDFVAEAGRMGHGLQMWLQTMWFLARTPRNATVILDEPDVYMHPDLQRRLVRLLNGRHAQVVVATHSAEIMAEVEPEDILVVERTRSRSNFAPSLPAVQRVIEDLGGVHNLHLARMWSARKFLMVEGNDLDILGPLHATLSPHSNTALQSLPHATVGGWSGLERAIGAATTLRNAVNQRIVPYCLLDSDYFPATTIEQRYLRAKEVGLSLHVWQRKEIENYLLVPAAVARVIADRIALGCVGPSAEDVEAMIERLAEAQRVDTTAALATEFQKVGKRVEAGTAYKEAEKRMRDAWETQGGRWSRISGKLLVSELSKWSKASYGVSFSAGTIARAMKSHEIHPELRSVLTAIERGESLLE